MKKIVVCVIIMIGVMIFMSPLQSVYADPMDPMQNIKVEETTEATSSGVGEGMLPNTPDEDEEILGEVDENETTTVNKTQEDWEAEEKQHRWVQFMDSVMFAAGIIGFIIPTIYMGIYLGARIFPPLFTPIFGFITKHRVNPEDIPWWVMFLRTIPVAVLGMLLAIGWLRKVIALIWEFVLTHFLK